MNIEIITIPLGFGQCYVLKGDGVIAIDAGEPKKEVFMPFIKIPKAKVDLVLGDDGLSLVGFGIPGRIVYTPGHSSGSVSVLLDTGEVFVGDLAMNKFPLCLSPGLPIFADDPAAVVSSWKMLIKLGASTVYPAHGSAFPIAVIEKAIFRAAS